MHATDLYELIPVWTKAHTIFTEITNTDFNIHDGEPFSNFTPKGSSTYRFLFQFSSYLQFSPIWLSIVKETIIQVYLFMFLFTDCEHVTF